MESSKTAVKDEKDSLRVELKVWERAFEKQHGHKPTPADVKANSEISAKYKLYHKSFRTKSTSSVNENVGPTKKRTEYVSPAKALKEITPQKNRQDDGLTPVKRPSLHDVEIVGPTPQLNGRMLGLFDGVQENTPISLKRKSDWPNNSAEAKRRQTPIKFTPRKPSLESLSPAESPMQETPTKSTSTLRSRFSTPVTQSSSLSNHHNFATPAFLRPTAGPINSPQSPSLPWERLPGKIKGFSALISDFKANQQHILKQEVEIEAWVDDDEEELKIVEEAAPNATERKPWVKKGAKRTKRRVKMRPVPQMEIPASDEEVEDSEPEQKELAKADEFHLPESGDKREEPQDEVPPELSEEPSDFEEDDLVKAMKPAAAPKSKAPKKSSLKKAKGGYKIGKQVSNNFVSYKIRNRGQRGRGRFGGGRRR